LERKVGTHDLSFRMNRWVLGVIVVDAWLAYSGGRGIRTGMDQSEFYEQLAGQLIDNDFDSGGLRDRQSDLVTPGTTPRSGIGAQLTLTKKKRKSKSVTSITFALQGKCCTCPAKTTHVCSSCLDDRDESYRPGFVTRTITVIALANTLGPSQLVKVQLHRLYALNGLIVGPSGAILN
jgi:hypothetical protein